MPQDQVSGLESHNTGSYAPQQRVRRCDLDADKCARVVGGWEEVFNDRAQHPECIFFLHEQQQRSRNLQQPIMLLTVIFIITSFPSPTHSFIPGLKPFFSANPSHRSISFSFLASRMVSSYPMNSFTATGDFTWLCANATGDSSWPFPLTAVCNFCRHILLI